MAKYLTLITAAFILAFGVIVGLSQDGFADDDESCSPGFACIPGDDDDPAPAGFVCEAENDDDDDDGVNDVNLAECELDGGPDDGDDDDGICCMADTTCSERGAVY